MPASACCAPPATTSRCRMADVAPWLLDRLCLTPWSYVKYISECSLDSGLRRRPNTNRTIDTDKGYGTGSATPNHGCDAIPKFLFSSYGRHACDMDCIGKQQWSSLVSVLA
jgi:hypothetical protein